MNLSRTGLLLGAIYVVGCSSGAPTGAPPTPVASAAGTASAAPSASSPARDLGAIEQLTWQRAWVLLRPRKCTADDRGRGPGPRDFELTCPMASGETATIALSVFDSKDIRDALFPVRTEKRVWVESGNQLLTASVVRAGTLDRAASEELLTAAIAAGRAEDPITVVDPVGTTWVRPRLVTSGGKVLVDPSLVTQLVAAMREITAQADVVVTANQGRDIGDKSDNVTPTVTIGTAVQEIVVRCAGPNDRLPPRVANAEPGEAIHVHERCSIRALARGDGLRPQKAPSAALLTRLLASPEPPM